MYFHYIHPGTNFCNFLSVSLLLSARQYRKEREGKLIYNLDGHEDGVNCLAVSSDDSVLVSGSEDNTARVWSIEDEEPAEDLEDLDELFDDDTEKKKDEDQKEGVDNKSENGDGEKGDEETKSIKSEKPKDDTTSQKSQEDDDEVEEVLKIDNEEEQQENDKEEDTVSTNETKNEGEKRCLGVLR